MHLFKYDIQRLFIHILVAMLGLEIAVGIVLSSLFLAHEAHTLLTGEEKKRRSLLLTAAHVIFWLCISLVLSVFNNRRFTRFHIPKTERRECTPKKCRWLKKLWIIPFFSMFSCSFFFFKIYELNVYEKSIWCIDPGILFAHKLRWLTERPVEELCKRVQQKKKKSEKGAGRGQEVHCACYVDS